MATGNTTITGRDTTPANQISWLPAESRLPMKHAVSGNRLAGALGLLIGLFWIAYFTDDILKALAPAVVLPELLMMGLVTLPGVFILLYGMSQYVYREETTVGLDGVYRQRRGLSGQRAWREPIANYRGVLKEHRYWHGSHGDAARRASHMVYLLRLSHADPGREVVLYRAESELLVPPADWPDKWQHYARLLHLPALEQTESGMSATDAGDLQQPLIDRISDGRLQVADIEPLQAPLGLMARLTRDDDLWVITCYPVWNAWKSIAGMVVLAAVLLGARAFELMDPQLFGYLVWLVPAGLLAIGLEVRRQIARPEQLALGKLSICHRYRDKQDEWGTDSMPLRSVYGIAVKSDPGHFRTPGDIVIEGEGKTIRFGWWLPKRTKLRIERLVLSLIARGVGGD
jgi:hypothetical protein